MTKDKNKKNHISALVITVLIFITAFFISNFLNQRKMVNIKNIENKISTNILSLETQFDLLKEASCSYIKENPVLSKELNSLSKRLSYTEKILGSDNEKVIDLKKSYTLLEIKDYLLMQKITEKCNTEPVFILYFYSNKGDCKKCKDMGHVLTYLREQYPKLRVYSFDFHLNISALSTLISIKNIKPELPALLINEKIYYGFKNIENMKEMLPLEKIEQISTSTKKSI